MLEEEESDGGVALLSRVCVCEYSTNNINAADVSHLFSTSLVVGDTNHVVSLRLQSNKVFSGAFGGRQVNLNVSMCMCEYEHMLCNEEYVRACMHCVMHVCTMILACYWVYSRYDQASKAFIVW